MRQRRRHRSRARLLLRLLLLLVMLLVTAPVAVWLALDEADQRRATSLLLSRVIGAKVTLGGPFELALAGTTTLQAQKLRLAWAGAAGGDAETGVIEIEKIAVQVDLRSLLFPPAIIRRLEVDGAHIDLKSGSFGRTGGPRPGDPGGLGSLLADLPLIDRMQLRDIEIFHHIPNELGDWHARIEMLSLQAAPDATHDRLAADLEVEGQAVSIEGESCPFEQLLDSNACAYRLQLKHPSFAARVDGTIEAPLEGRGLDLAVELRADDAAELRALSPYLRLPTGRLEARARLLGRAEAPTIADLDLAFEDSRTGRIAAAGSIADAESLSGVDLRLSAELRDPGRLLGEPGTALPLTALQGNGRLTRADRIWSLEVSELTAEAAGASRLQTTGEVRLEAILEPWRWQDSDLTVTLRSGDPNALLTALSAELEPKLPPLGPTEVDGRVNGPSDTLRLEVARAEVVTPDLQLEASGQAEAALVEEGADLTAAALDLVLSAAQTEAVFALLGEDVTLPEPLQARARLSYADATIGLEDLDLHVGPTDAPIYRLQGKVAEISPGARPLFAGIDLRAEVEGSAIRIFTDLVDEPWPEPGKARGSLQLVGDWTTLEVRDLAAKVTGESGMVVLLDADGDRPTVRLGPDEGFTTRDLHIPFRLGAPSSSALSSFALLDLPDLGETRASGLVTERQDLIDVRDFRLEVGPEDAPLLSLSGAIEDLLEVERTRFLTDFETVAVERLGPLIGLDIPPIGSISGYVEISTGGPMNGLDLLELRTLDSDALTVSLRPIVGPAKRGDAELQFEIESNRLQHIRNLFTDREPMLQLTAGLWSLPGALRGRLWEDSARDVLGFDGEFDIQSTRFTTTFEVDRSSEPVFVFTEISTDLLHLGEIWRPSPTEERESTYLFSRQPFELEGLEQFDVDIRFSADQVLDPYTGLKRLAADVFLTEGAFKVVQAHIDHPDGNLVIDLSLDTAVRPPTFGLRLDFNDVDVGTVLERFGTERFLAGDLTGVVDLRSSGNSMHELAADANGTVGLALENGRLNGGDLHLLAPNSLAWMTAAGARRRHTDIRCAIARFTVGAGVANADSLVVVTPRMTLAGGGQIDLGEESLDLVLAAESGPSSFEKPLRLRGPLSNPEVEVSTTGHFADVAKTGAGTVFLPFVFLPWKAASYLFSRINEPDDENECLSPILDSDTESQPSSG